MKRIFFTLILFLAFCPHAKASGNANAIVCTPTAGTACSWASTPSFGNLMISCAYRGTSATAPTTATNYTVIKSTTGNTNSLKCGWKISLGNETTGGTWANATDTFGEAYTGNWFANLGAGAMFGANTSGITESGSTAISYPTFTLSNTLSTSWVFCAGGSNGGSIDTAPSGMTMRSGTGITSVAFSDTNGNVTTWSTTAGPNPSAVNASVCGEIIGSPAMGTLTNYLVNEVLANGSAEVSTTPFTLTIPVPSTLSNNYLEFDFNWQYASVAPTVSSVYCNSDTGHATWTWALAKSFLDTANTTDTFAYYIAGATAGCESVSVVASSAWTTVSAEFFQYRQIATSNPIDSSASNSNNSAIYLTSGALSPSQSGDIIGQHCFSAGGQGTGLFTDLYTSGGITTLSASYGVGNSTSAFVETGSASLTPYMYAAGSGFTADCIGLALKASAAAGTAPTGVNIVKIENQIHGAGATQQFQIHNVAAGDAMVLVSDGNESASTKQWTTISSLIDTLTSYQPNDANGGYPNWALDCDIAAGDDIISFTGAPTGASPNYYVMEVAGLDNSSHTACFDSGTGKGNCSGAGCVSGIPTNAGSGTTGAGNFSPIPTIAPSTATGIVIESSQLGTGEPIAFTSPTCANFQVATYSGQTDGSYMGFGNFYGWCLNTSTSSQTWSATNGVDTTFNANAIALEAAAATGKCAACDMSLLWKDAQP